MNPNFFSFVNLFTLGAIGLMGIFCVLTIRRNQENFGQKILIAIFFGLTICIAAAIRDGYGFAADAIIPFVGSLSSIFSLLGATMVFSAISSIFIRKVAYRKNVFILITTIFFIKFLLMEAVRLSVLL